MRLALEEDDALELADGAYTLGEEARAISAAAGCSLDEQACIQLAAMNLSDDTLILLALASAKGTERVQAFRDWRQRAGRAGAEWREQDDAQWNARYAQLAAALLPARE